VNVERQAKEGKKFEPTEYRESLQLSWASQFDRAYDAFDIPHDAPHFVDVASTRQLTGEFEPSTRTHPLRYGKLLQPHGTYRFTVVVSGDGVKPVTIRPVVSWNGVWDQVAKAG
jgi:hypothetical protein